VRNLAGFGVWGAVEQTPDDDFGFLDVSLHSLPRRDQQNQTVGVAPPSMRKVVPVTKSLSGLAIKQTAAAMSFGCPSRVTVC
jgi:hypothetical protein